MPGVCDFLRFVPCFGVFLNKKWRISAGLRCFFVAHPAFCGCFFSVYNNKNNLLLTVFNKLDYFFVSGVLMGNFCRFCFCVFIKVICNIKLV